MDQDETKTLNPDNLPMDTVNDDDNDSSDGEPTPGNPRTTGNGAGDNSDSDDSDSEDDEASLREEIANLESELAVNPSSYDAHAQYVKVLRRAYEVEKLNKARETMSELFPLTPTMWMEWARDEASQALSSGPEGLSSVEKLYERGVIDYLSVPLWCDYLNFVQQHDPSVTECSPAGIAKARNLFERAITAAGLHVTEGNRIWEAYREFEQAILLTIDQADHKGRELQVQRIRSIFHRNLSIPHLDMKSTLLAYKAWELEQGNPVNAESDDMEGIASHVSLAYQKALHMCNARLEHEENISKKEISDSEKFQCYMNYLNFEKTTGDPARVQLLYERAVTDLPVSSDLWLDYTHYLDRTLKVGTVAKDVYSRATRNCSWVGEIWAGYLLSLERSQSSEGEISAVFERSLQCTFSTLEEYLDLFLTRIDGLRRRIVSGREADMVDYSLIKQTFQYASDYLSPQMKNTDSLLHLYAYWARLELTLAKDLVAARGVWESLLKISGSMLGAWQGYIAMEIELCNITEARAIYKRCYSKRFQDMGSEEICRSWLRFEREYGMLEDFDHALLKVTPRLEELRLFKMQQESKGITGPVVQGKNLPQKSSREKRKTGPNNADESPPAKKKKQAAQVQTKGPDKRDSDKQKAAAKNSTEEGKVDAESIQGAQSNKTDSEVGRTKLYTDQCTAFVSNINLQAKNEDLEKFFSDVGGVVSIRILRDKFTGKSRGLAYVDFSDDKHLVAAIDKNKQTLMGKRLSIVRSNPKQNKKDGRALSKNQVVADEGEGSGKNAESTEPALTVKDTGAPSSQRSTTRRRDENVRLKGSNTFAVPRNVRPLGVKPMTAAANPEEETPKSNDEFRKMFIKD